MEKQNNILIYENEVGDIKVDVHLENESVWLTQEQMAFLFGKGRSTITEHILNIFKEEELEEQVVCRNFRRTTPHGAIAGKTQTKNIKRRACTNNATCQHKRFIREIVRAVQC